MITFDTFSIEDGIPIYLQIILHLKRGAAAGQIANGDELPSRRVLSARLGVNPNTVQKAYHMLEEEGLITSQSGAKSYMVLDGGRVEEIRRQLLETDVKPLVGAMARMGLSRQEALALVAKYWPEE